MNKASERQRRYDADNTVRVNLKLNKQTDKEILAKLDEVESKQGYIRELINRDIRLDTYAHAVTDYLEMGYIPYECRYDEVNRNRRMKFRSVTGLFRYMVYEEGETVYTCQLKGEE